MQCEAHTCEGVALLKHSAECFVQVEFATLRFAPACVCLWRCDQTAGAIACQLAAAAQQLAHKQRDGLEPLHSARVSICTFVLVTLKQET